MDNKANGPYGGINTNTRKRRSPSRRKFQTKIVYDDDIISQEEKNAKDEEPKPQGRRVLKKSVKIAIAAIVFIFLFTCFGAVRISSGRSALRRYPVSFSSSVKSVAASDGAFYVTTQSSLSVLNFSAVKSEENALSFSDCCVKTEGKYALLYDNLGTGFILYKNGKIVLPQKKHESGQIYTAAVCKKGFFAIASKCKNAASELTLYSSSGEEVFKWQCASDFIVSIAISKDAKHLLCACINAAGGQRLTRVYYFDIQSESNNKDYTFNDTFAVDCFFSKGSKSVVVCSDRRIVLPAGESKSTPNTVMFGSSLALRANSTTGRTYAVLKNSGDLEEYTIVCYDLNNTEKFRTEFSGKIKDIACRKNTAYILTDKEIVELGAKNKTKAVLSSQADGILFGGKGLYYYNINMLYKV